MSKRHIGVMALLSAVALSGCKDSTAPAISKEESLAIAGNLFGAMASALASAGISSVVGAQNAGSFSFSGACPKGGSISGSGSETGSLNQNGTGTESFSLSYAPNNCVVDGGSGKTYTVNGNPNITMGWSASYTNYNLSSNITYNVGGGFKFDGGSCAMNYTMVFTPSGRYTISGSICGQSVSQSY